MYKKFDEQAKNILSKLTLKEKIGQLNQVMLPETDEEIEKLKKRIKNGEIGSIILANSATAGNIRQSAVQIKLLNELQQIAVDGSKSGVPLIYGRDVIHGHKTVFPVPLAQAASFDPKLVEESYRMIAKEAAADGVHWTFAPMSDVCREPRWGRMIEGSGEDPLLSSKMAAAAVRGFQGGDLSEKDSLAACVKHYIGYGFSEGGRDYFRTEISDYTLYNTVLPPFKAAVDAGVATVMSSFNDISGQPVTSSRKYLTDILRGKLGFEGFVISDWGAVDQLMKQGVAETAADCTAAALTAGLDMDMVDEDYFNNLEKLVSDGKLDESVIDLAVLRVLRIKIAKGLFEHPYCEEIKYNREEHKKKALELAAESAVLLKNEGGLLPLSKKGLYTVAGPFMREKEALFGSWNLDGIVEEAPSFLEAVKSKVDGVGEILTAEQDTLLDSTARNMIFADVTLLALGESHAVTGEARSVADVSISDAQTALAKKAKQLGKKTVGVIFCGRPLGLEKIEPYLDAILCVWHGGTETAEAAAQLIFGERVPSGKTPVTFVRQSGQIPLYYNVTSSGRYVNGYYGEGNFENYCDTTGSPMYPFGYGLSYTEFEYSDVAANRKTISVSELKNGEKINLTVNIKNVGNIAAREIAELYIRDPLASYMRPLRELKAFKKIKIEPKETAAVNFSLGFDDLGFYTPDGEYTVESGKIEVYIGGNCYAGNKIEIEID